MYNLSLVLVVLVFSSDIGTELVTIETTRRGGSSRYRRCTLLYLPCLFRLRRPSWSPKPFVYWYIDIYICMVLFWFFLSCFILYGKNTHFTHSTNYLHYIDILEPYWFIDWWTNETPCFHTFQLSHLSTFTPFNFHTFQLSHLSAFAPFSFRTFQLHTFFCFGFV